MKQLMLGNAAIARGMYEAGCKVVSSYPGTPSTEITEEAVKFSEIYCEWAPNEKVAVETAFGASLAGVRSACAMKHVGLNVAADPVFSISYIGIKGGMVICVADDPGMHSSQNEQDSRHYARASKIPMLEPSDSAEALTFTKLAFELSEEYGTPVFLKMCTRVAHSQSVVETGSRVERETIPYVKDVHNVMTPANAKVRHPIVEERTKKLIAYAEETPINRIEWGEGEAGKEIGIITSSTSSQYVKEVFGDSVSVLKLGMIWPLPEKKLIEFAAAVKKLVVVEELDPFIEEHCKKLGLRVEGKEILPMCDEFSQNLLRRSFSLPVPESKALSENVPVRPPVMCSGCPHRGIFYTLMKEKCTVIGDIGCYTLGSAAPLLAMDINICMGASVSAEHGFNTALGKASQNKTVSVIGDSTFVHSGMTSLANIAYNQSASTVIILDNSITGMTGHQQNPTTGYNIKGDPAGKIDLEALIRAMGIERVSVVDPYNLAQCDEVLKRELAADEPSVIISRRPCVLLKSVKTNPPLHVDPEKCRGCKSCMKMGCPSISIRDGKAQIDQTLCVGCGVCKQLCHFDAFAG